MDTFDPFDLAQPAHVVALLDAAALLDRARDEIAYDAGTGGRQLDEAADLLRRMAHQ